MSGLEWVVFSFGVVSVWLTTRENSWCWPLGIVSVSLQAVLFGRERLYASSGLQVVYVGLCAYGWWAWVRGGPGETALRVSRMPRRASLFLLGTGTVLGVLLGLLLGRTTDQAVPFWDAGTTSFSLIAQWMQARKWLENWVVWIVVNVVCVGIYLYKGIVLMAVLYAIYGALAILGLRAWTRALRDGGA